MFAVKHFRDEASAIHPQTLGDSGTIVFVIRAYEEIIDACAEHGKASTVLGFTAGDFTALGQVYDVVVPGTI